MGVGPEPTAGGRTEEGGGPPLQDRLGRLQNPLENRLSGEERARFVNERDAYLNAPKGDPSSNP